jgi:single-stranded DNA-binding protein
VLDFESDRPIDINFDPSAQPNQIGRFGFTLRTLINLLEIPMQVTISGYTGRDIKVVSSDDGHTATINEAPLAVKIAETTDWYLLKFASEALIKASQYLRKGTRISVVGELTFEDWIDESQTRCSKPVVMVSDLQLPAKS